MTTQNNVVISAKSQGIVQVMKEIERLKNSLRQLGQQGQQAKSTYAERQQKAKEYLGDRRTKTGMRTGAAQNIAGRGLNVAEAGAVAGMQASIDPTLTGQQRATQTMQNMAADAMLPDPSKFGKAESKALEKMNTQYDRIVDKGSLYERQQRELGHAAKISAKEVLGLRVQIEKLRASQSFQSNATSEQVNRLRMLEAQLLKMQSTAVKSTSSFQFMAGASILVQKGIRNIGAAAQGAMLAMSLLKGDVMGTAFSLIFLQFAANLPVALGFGAIAIAGVLAFKAIKKIYSTKKEVKQFTEAFMIATGNVEAYALAQDRAAEVVASLGIKGDDQAKAVKVATAAIMDMEMRKQKVTRDSIGISVKAWVVAGRTAKDEAERQNTALDAVQKHMEGNQMTIGGYLYDTKRLNQETARELIAAGGSFMAFGTTVGEAMIAMGASEKELQDVSHEMLEMSMADLFESSVSHEESKNKMMRWFNDMELGYKDDYGEQQKRVLGMIEEFDKENKAKSKSVSRLKTESERDIAQMWEGVEQKRLSDEQLKAMDRGYVESFTERVDGIIAEMKRLEAYRTEVPQMSLGQLDKFQQDTGKQLLKERDVEYRTGEFLGKENRYAYGTNEQDLEFSTYQYGETGQKEEIIITLEDQTKGGLNVTQTISKQMAGVVTSAIGLASESGDF